MSHLAGCFIDVRCGNSISLSFVASVLILTDVARAATRPDLNEVVVTATRAAADPFDIPVAISSVSGEQLRHDTLGVNLADDVAMVPGLLARNRNNYAQDQQVSIRGIGANSAFGIRGVRIYQDGIPATGADGQGQISQFNLDSASRVEILRGPFSALYGNSSGGVIQLFTADSHEPAQMRTAIAYGSYDTLRAGVNVAGNSNQLGYNLAFTHFQTGGYRDHSSARNESFNAKFNYAYNDASRLALIANVIARPDAQDPLGLTPQAFLQGPQQTDATAILFNTRKSLQQQQIGLIYDLDITAAHSLRLIGYYGHREVQQFLSIPTATQAATTSAGGVVDLDRRFGGLDARWLWQGNLAGSPMYWVLGASYDRQNELRRGYNNFIGSTLGLRGALRRDENNIAYNIDQYLQGTWEVSPLWSVMAGVRRSDIHFDSQDHFVTAGNIDDSGAVEYSATSPVAGLMFKARPWLHVYASYGRGFQTPVGSELAYRADGGTGLNLGLQPARSNSSELGAKLQLGQTLSWQGALFQTLTRNEIVINTNTGGRSTYQNGGRTRREGVEASMDYRFAPDWHLQFAYTHVEAAYRDAYLACASTPCTAPNVLINAGNRLPGVPKNNVFVALNWGRDLGWRAGVNGQYMTNVPVNDFNSVLAPSYAVFGVDGGYAATRRSFTISTFLRINNLFDRRYVGSIIVNDGNSRYFEPAPGLNLLAGLTITKK